MLLLRPIMVGGLLLRLLYYAAIYVRRPERRRGAKVHLQAFWQSLKLGFRWKPYELPLALSRRSSSPPPRLTVTVGQQ